MTELSRRCTPPTSSRTQLDQLLRRDGLGGRGSAAGGQLLGRRGHPGRDHPRRERHPGRRDGATRPAAAAGQAAKSEARAPTPNVIPGACGPNGRCSSRPRASSLTGTASDNPAQPTAQSLGITGSGVKVAWIADGIDPNNVNFIRPNGTSVFDPSTAATTRTSPATARARRPPATRRSLTPTDRRPGPRHLQPERLLRAVLPRRRATSDPGRRARRQPGRPGRVRREHQRCTRHHRVQLPPGDQLRGRDRSRERAQRVVRQQPVPRRHRAGRDQAVRRRRGRGGRDRRGLSTGDAGSTNTIGSPATDPNVISVGACTQFQAYAQTNYALARDFAKTGWLSDNISSLSSGGTDETGGTVDLVAPGDISFASCDASAIYYGCVNFQGQSSDIEESGGTSESSPFVAGAAALVIQAYEKTHGGASADAGAGQADPGQHRDRPRRARHRAGLRPAQQLQGGRAGRVHQDQRPARPRPVGDTLELSSQPAQRRPATPGTAQSWPETVTNTGAQHPDGDAVRPRLRPGRERAVRTASR